MTYQIIVDDEVRFCTKWLVDADIIIEDYPIWDCVVVDSTTGEGVREYKDGVKVYEI